MSYLLIMFQSHRKIRYINIGEGKTYRCTGNGIEDVAT